MSAVSFARTPPGVPVRSLRRVIAVTLALTILTALASGGYLVHRLHPALPALAEGGVALGAGGAVVEVADPAALVPGTRVLAGTADSARLAAEQRAWLRRGRVPVVPGLAGSAMVQDALLDLQVLSSADGVPVAGWTGPWRYVWPRDAALVAAAFARTGHLAEAERIVAFLERVQPPDGRFQARYLPDGSGAPDGRGIELDGLGWALWAAAQTADALPGRDRVAFVNRHRRLLDTSTRAIVALTASPDGLPPVSMDYWETPETTPTLATAAVLLAGLRAAARLDALRGDLAAGRGADAAAARLATSIRDGFGRDDYPRRLGGRADSVDLGVDFLLPPFGTAEDPDALRVWRQSPTVLARPAGGLAPGGSWPRDGLSWTNITATYALTAACVGDRTEALARLRWLDAHRTAVGSLPEKVQADGSPASVAPLAWTAAVVVLTADQLSRPARS